MRHPGTAASALLPEQPEAVVEALVGFARDRSD
jgi:hypothetical protein